MAAWAAWLSTLACPRPAAGVPQVSVRPAVSGWAGRALAGRSCPGIVTHIRGGSVIFGALTGELACSAVLAHVLVGRRGTRAARAFGRAVAQQVGSFVGSCAVEVYSKRLDYQSGRPDLNRRPLDPQECFPNAAICRNASRPRSRQRPGERARASESRCEQNALPNPLPSTKTSVALSARNAGLPRSNFPGRDVTGSLGAGARSGTPA